ncbi:hypothetical protein ACO0SA_000014 [Hanseniaspora valbyensis]
MSDTSIDTSSSSTDVANFTWTKFIKNIASFKGDLSSLTAPPFILSPVSLTEFSQYWSEHPDLLLAANNAGAQFEPRFDNVEYTDELNQFLFVVRWFISTLKSQYSSRNESMGSEKKPLNPFLGEVFVGKWEHKEPQGTTVCLSEQVSHHPPITAYSIFNDTNKISLQGYNQAKPTFSSAMLSVKQFGHALLKIGDFNEYLLTLPSLHIEGLIAASPYVELDGKSFIQGSFGHFAVIDFFGKGWMSGKKNSFKCKIYNSKSDYDCDEKALFVISGQWSGISTIYTGDDEKKKKNPQEFYDASRIPVEQLQVKPIEEQNEFESRRAWKDVAAAIKEGDFNKIHQTKTVLEEAQRTLRKNEEESGNAWETRWFDLIPVDEDNRSSFMKLATLAQLSLEDVPSGTIAGSKDEAKWLKEDALAQHWRFNRQKWDDEKDITL